LPSQGPALSLGLGGPFQYEADQMKMPLNKTDVTSFEPFRKPDFDSEIRQTPAVHTLEADDHDHVSYVAVLLFVAQCRHRITVYGGI
jgi:hypothetical protein